MKRNEIWIFVDGGCVSQVRATDPTLKVNIIDYDNLQCSDEDTVAYAELEMQSEKMPVVF